MMSKTEKVTRKYLETLSKDRVIELCLQFMFDAEVSEQQLDQANERLNEHNEYFKAFNCKDFKEFQDFISSFMLTPHEEQTLIKDLQNQLNQANERLKGAIIPRYKIGTKLYMIPTEFNRLKGIKDYELLSISLSSIGLRHDLSLNKKEKGVEPFYCASEDMFGQSIFSTLEEAEKKLQELRGGE